MKINIKDIARKNYGLISIVVIYLWIYILSILLSQETFTTFYRSYFFAWMKKMFVPISNWISLPFLYVIIVIFVFSIIRKSIQKGIKNGLILLFKWLVLLFCWFYILWGFNYKCTTLSHSFSTSGNIITHSELVDRYIKSVNILNTIKQVNIKFKVDENELLSQLNTTEIELLKKYNYKNISSSRLKKLEPKGVLLRFSTSGFYFPFGFEGYYDAGLYELQLPFTMAHEMAHGFGITDEGECNFLAYLACQSSSNDVLKYSAEMSLYAYLKRYIPKEVRDTLIGLNEFVKKDITAISSQMDLYPDILPDLRNLIYDQYLKSNGVSTGINSYSTFVQMIINYEKLIEN
ncbi:MAG: DUF3810 family protein [Saprospiraceae bacterium]|nr:DUF3810 family protein [Saprospiraceae bacterium]